MVKKRKLFERALANPQNVRFEVFVTLLQAFGFVQDRVRGSHHIFIHANVTEILSIQPRKDGKAKPYQVRQFFKLVEQYDLKLIEDES